MAKQLAFNFDASACTSCRACQAACMDRANLDEEVTWRKVVQYGGGSWVPHGNTMVPNHVFNYGISLSCMHCQDPACVTVCPTTALYKRAEDGIVLVDATKCIGCRYCEWACPYGAVHFDAVSGVMTKCDFCNDLLAKGGKPACVEACVMRCLDFGDLEELRAKYGNFNEIAPLPKSDLTQPSFVVTPHRHTEVSGFETGTIVSLPEEI